MLKHNLVRSVAVCGLIMAGLAIQGHSQESQNSSDPVATGLVGLPHYEPESAAQQQTLIYSLRNRPATMVANTIAMVMEKKSGLTIVPDQLSNVLIICGTADTLQKCQDILKEIDQPRRMIHFEVVISIVPSGVAGPDKSEERLIDRIQFATLDENPANYSFGQRVAIASGTVGKGFGQGPPSRTYQIQQVGTMFNVTPRIAGEEIAVDLQVEKSWLVDPTGGDAASDAGPKINSTTVKSTVSLKPGVAHTVFANVTQGTNATENVSITITASLDEAKEH